MVNSWLAATTEVAIRALPARPGALLVAATDSNLQGDVFGDRMREITAEAGCAFERLRSARDDWNEASAGGAARTALSTPGRREEGVHVNSITMKMVKSYARACALLHSCIKTFARRRR